MFVLSCARAKKAMSFEMVVAMIIALAILAIAMMLLFRTGSTYQKSISDCVKNQGKCVKDIGSCTAEGGVVVDFECPPDKPFCCRSLAA